MPSRSTASSIASVSWIRNLSIEQAFSNKRKTIRKNLPADDPQAFVGRPASTGDPRNGPSDPIAPAHAPAAPHPVPKRHRIVRFQRNRNHTGETPSLQEAASADSQCREHTNDGHLLSWRQRRCLRSNRTDGPSGLLCGRRTTGRRLITFILPARSNYRKRFFCESWRICTPPGCSAWDEAVPKKGTGAS